MDERTARVHALGRALGLGPGRAALGLLASAEITVVAPPDGRVLGPLIPFLLRLTASGARTGRIELVIATLDGTPVTDEVIAPVMERAPAVRIHRHDPKRASWFSVTVDGASVALDDVLRESEMIVLANLVPATGDPASLTRLLVPGLAAPPVREQMEKAPPDGSARVAETLGVDLVVAFDESNATRAYCGPLAGLGNAVWWS